MKITHTTMRSWGWPEEAIAWYDEDQRLLDGLNPHDRGWYDGYLDACCQENGLQDGGVSHHRLPVYPVSNDLVFDFRTMLAVLTELDSDANIFQPGFTVLQASWGPEPYLFLACTEAVHALSEEEYHKEFPMVSWGYRESAVAANVAWEDFKS